MVMVGVVRGGVGGLAALEMLNGLGQQLGVQVEAHSRDMAALARAEDVACAADFEIAHGESKPEPSSFYSLMVSRRERAS